MYLENRLKKLLFYFDLTRYTLLAREDLAFLTTYPNKCTYLCFPDQGIMLHAQAVCTLTNVMYIDIKKTDVQFYLKPFEELGIYVSDTGIEIYTFICRLSEYNKSWILVEL